MTRTARSFWALVAIAALAMGTLSKAVVATPGPATGIAVALSATLLAVSLALAARILVRTERHPREPPAP